MQHTHNYLNVIVGDGLLIIVRVPYPDEPRWSAILRALTGVMREYGKRQKDIYNIESFLVPDNEMTEGDARFIARVEAAYTDASILPTFTLYTWVGDRQRGTFELVRRGTA